MLFLPDVYASGFSYVEDSSEIHHIQFPTGALARPSSFVGYAHAVWSCRWYFQWSFNTGITSAKGHSTWSVTTIAGARAII